MDNSANNVTVQDLDWCLDSRATNHMVVDQGLFHKFEDYTSTRGVIIRNGEKMKITKIGKIKFNINSKKCILNRVLCVPNLRKILIFTKRLCRDLDCAIHLTAYGFVNKDWKTQVELFLGVAEGGFTTFLLLRRQL